MLHKYKLGGYNIVLDVDSGCIHLVDELTFDILDSVSPPFEENCPEWVYGKFSRFYSREEIKSCYAEISALHKDELIFTAYDYENLASYMEPSPVKAMCLIAASDCNLECEYCFAHKGDYGTGRRRMLDYATGTKAIDFLVENSSDREVLEIDFFGGEPLLNYDIIKRLVEYGRGLEKSRAKSFRFTLTTNGLLLDSEKIEFINSEMSNIVLSLDGRPEVNDRMRVKRGGTGGCYADVIDKFKELVSGRGEKDWYIRGTYTRHNLDFAEDVLHLYRQGFERISIEPAVSASDADYAITRQDLPRIFSEYERLAGAMLDGKNKNLIFFHFVLDLTHGPCAIKRLMGCGSGNEYIAVTPDGEIYPCHQFIGQDIYKMGNVNTGEFNMTMKEMFSKTHIYSKDECRKCWARFYCSGGCNANNYICTGNINMPHKLSCEIQKKRLECAIMLKAATEQP